MIKSFKTWLQEMAGTGAIVDKPAPPGADYQVWGAPGVHPNKTGKKKKKCNESTKKKLS